MIQLSQKLRTEILVWGLMISVFALPLSVFLISVGQFLILLNWIVDSKWKAKWVRFKERPSLWLIGLFYIVHLVWLFNTSDFYYAAHDLKIKLPFLIIPLIIGTSELLDANQVKKIILAFCIGVFISSIYSTFKIYTISGDPMAFGKEISPFVSHIRLALMVDFAVFSLFWAFNAYENDKFRYLYLFLAVWFCFFLVILQSLTGVVVFFATAGIYTLVIVVKSKQLMLKWFLCILLLLLILLPSTYLIHTYTRYFALLPVDTVKLDKYTMSGNAYWHDVHSKYLENANYTYLYICDKELQPEWEKRSKFKYDDLDSNGQQVKFTLFRYLTSKGLRKDSAGIAHLDDADIENIENGIANVMYTEKNGMKPRIYRLMWELYHYNLGANPTGYSVAQRIEYLKTALRIISKNFWFGTGTGDVVKAFQQQYELDNSQLAEKWRLRAHNQLITFFLTFGLIGFLFIVVAIFLPPFIEKRYCDYLFLSFFIIFVLSILNEDTLETHAGISFIAIFYALFLYSKKDYKPLIVGKKDLEIS